MQPVWSYRLQRLYINRRRVMEDHPISISLILSMIMQLFCMHRRRAAVPLIWQDQKILSSRCTCTGASSTQRASKSQANHSDISASSVRPYIVS